MYTYIKTGEQPFGTYGEHMTRYASGGVCTKMYIEVGFILNVIIILIIILFF